MICLVVQTERSAEGEGGGAGNWPGNTEEWDGGGDGGRRVGCHQLPGEAAGGAEQQVPWRHNQVCLIWNKYYKVSLKYRDIFMTWVWLINTETSSQSEYTLL